MRPTSKPKNTALSMVSCFSTLRHRAIIPRVPGGWDERVNRDLSSDRPHLTHRQNAPMDQ